jgi:hypothetical protein
MEPEVPEAVEDMRPLNSYLVTKNGEPMPFQKRKAHT